MKENTRLLKKEINDFSCLSSLEKRNLIQSYLKEEKQVLLETEGDQDHIWKVHYHLSQEQLIVCQIVCDQSGKDPLASKSRLASILYMKDHYCKSYGRTFELVREGSWNGQLALVSHTILFDGGSIEDTIWIQSDQQEKVCQVYLPIQHSIYMAERYAESSFFPEGTDESFTYFDSLSKIPELEVPWMMYEELEKRKNQVANQKILK